MSDKTSKKVESNTHHIDENTREIKNNTKMIHILYIIIIVLMMVIAGLAFYVGTLYNSWGNTPSATVSAEDVTVTIIDDSRCTECQTAAITWQIKALPFLAGAEFVEQDFSDSWVSNFLEANNITTLPAIIFSTNILNDGGQIAPYLTALPEWDFSLALGSTFDPFATRSARGFLQLEETEKTSILSGSYYLWSPNAEITWIEYTDLNCHFCQVMEEDGTAETLLTKYEGKLNKVTHNFIGVGGQKTQTWAEILECIGAEAWAEAYNNVLSQALSTKASSESDMLGYAVDQGLDEASIKACLDNGDMKSIVAERFATWQNTFGVTGTPGNIIINNETGEYTLVSGAVPATSFETVIDSLLQ